MATSASLFPAGACLDISLMLKMLARDHLLRRQHLIRPDVAGIGGVRLGDSDLRFLGRPGSPLAVPSPGPATPSLVLCWRAPGRGSSRGCLLAALRASRRPATLDGHQALAQELEVNAAQRFDIESGILLREGAAPQHRQDQRRHHASDRGLDVDVAKLAVRNTGVEHAADERPAAMDHLVQIKNETAPGSFRPPPASASRPRRPESRSAPTSRAPHTRGAAARARWHRRCVPRCGRCRRRSPHAPPP
jgi:hypothetical protein